MTDRADWARVESVFDAVLAAPGARRRETLDRLSAGDAALRQEVESLLAAHDASANFLEMSVAAFAAPLVTEPGAAEADDSLVGSVIDRYRLVKELGRGGGGRVYLAERADGQFEHRVALKVMRAGGDSRLALERFVRERQILATLDHPNIARLFDGGVTSDARPYLVMELIDGQTITAYCAEHQLNIDHRLRLFMTICRAVQYAHRHVIVHRDLKPTNVLVTADGVVKLLDFGIATLADAPSEAALGGAVMTPEYASPEQVAGGRITTASDVYQLGVLLCELLTGRRPHTARGDRAALLRAIREEPAPMPSSLADLTRAGAGRVLRGDLDAIVLMALSKNPDERYPSVEQFANDVERYLTHVPTRAGGATPAIRLHKFTRRHRLAATFISVFVITAIGLTTFYTVQVRRERDRARQEADKAMASARLLSGLFERWDPDASDRRAVSAAQVLADSARSAERELLTQPETFAATASVLGNLNATLGQIEEARRLLNQALAIQEQRPPSLDLAATLLRISSLQRMTGDALGAVKVSQRALAMYREWLGASHPETLAVQLRAVGPLQDIQDFRQCEALLRDILSKLPDRANALGTEASGVLGYILFMQGRYGEAVAELRPALARAHQLFGDAHPTTIVIMQYLASSLREPSQLPEAEQLVRDALRIRRELYGDARPETAHHALGLAVLLDRKGDFADAERIARLALTYWEGLGLPHIAHAMTMRTIGGLRLAQGDRSGAEMYLRRSLTMIRQLFPNGTHEDEGDVLNRLAYVLHARASSDAAEIYQQAVAFDRKRAPGSPAFITDGYEYLAAVAAGRGDRDLARALYQRAASLYQRELPEGHPYRLAAERGLASLR